jgi:hypothetical protein
MAQFIPAKDDWAKAFSSFGSGATEGYINRSDDNSIQAAIQNLPPNAGARDVLNAITGAKTYRPEAKQRALSNYLGVEQFEELKRKAKSEEEIKRAKVGKPGEIEQLVSDLVSQGYTPVEAKIIANPAVPKSVKQDVSDVVTDELSRGVRKPPTPQQNDTEGMQQPKQSTPTQEQVQASVGQDIPLPVEEAIAPIEAAVEKVPGKPQEEWPEISPPPETKASDRVRWREKNQTFNSKELKEVTAKNQASQDALIHYNRLTALNDTGKVQDGVSRLLIDSETGEPFKNVQKLAGVNKETQQYVKTLNDFISQAKNFFGARVTNFDLQSFKARLPTLLNSEDGRRAIIEQMRLLTELQMSYDTTLAKGLKHYGNNASYSDILKVAEEKGESEQTEIIGKINNLDTATNYLDKMAKEPKYKDHQLVFNPETQQFRAILPSDLNRAQSKGYKTWRTAL